MYRETEQLRVFCFPFSFICHTKWWCWCVCCTQISTNHTILKVPHDPITSTKWTQNRAHTAPHRIRHCVPNHCKLLYTHTHTLRKSFIVCENKTLFWTLGKSQTKTKRWKKTRRARSSIKQHSEQILCVYCLVKIALSTNLLRHI